MKKIESLNSKKMRLSELNMKGGLSPEAAAQANLREWVTRTNVLHGPTGGYAASQTGHDNSPNVFGDLSLDSNQS